MGWFKRLREGIQTTTEEKKEVPDGLWHKCIECSHTSTTKELIENFWCWIDSNTYFDIIFDKKPKLLFEHLEPIDMLGFVDLKPYKQRLLDTQKKTGLKDALSVGIGKVNDNTLIVACMDFKFIGGSMGSVVGEKIALAIDLAIKKKYPLLIISKTGGARMMESAFSLMQMAKTSAKLSQLGKAGLPYFSLMTDPTTGGVTASFAMLGDVNLAEPKALIGFAGPRVIKETIKRDLPEGFQTSEFLLEAGFLDVIVKRKDLKDTLSNLILFFKN